GGYALDDPGILRHRGTADCRAEHALSCNQGVGGIQAFAVSEVGFVPAHVDPALWLRGDAARLDPEALCGGRRNAVLHVEPRAGEFLYGHVQCPVGDDRALMTQQRRIGSFRWTNPAIATQPVWSEAF